jgi:class 3 adenylate cyclase
MTSNPSGTVTFLFTDVEGSTRRWEEHLDAMRGAMARHDGIVRTAIETRRGVVFTTAGDEFCSAFSSPRSALDAAIAAQVAITEANWGDVAPFRVRMAIHSGNADERDGDYFGPPLNRCARLLSIAHGGQVLLSAATCLLLESDIPPDVALVDLGPHQLKDLDRPEHVYQLSHPLLVAEFPPLRSSSAVRDAADLLADGRQAHAAQQWEAAYQALTAAGAVIELDSGDLRRLGDAAYWTGHTNEAVTIKEKSYGLLAREGDDQGAALTALDLAFLYKYRLATAVSKAWLSRAENLVRDAPRSVAHGYLVRWKSASAFEAEGDADAALELADEVIAIGRELSHRSLEALGLMDKGRFLVAMGKVDEGMALVDESMVAAVAGELDADATGRNYCNMLAVCEQVADYQRASEWSDAAEAWCSQHSDSAYPGICRVFRAELKWLRGDWHAAAEDLSRAVDELTGYTPIIGAALYQMGQVALRAGNLEEAERQFAAAHEHGFTPLPGMAELRLARGDAAGGEQLLLDALVQDAQPLERARHLPALIDIEIALGHLDEARAFVNELEEVGDLCHSAAMRASALDRRASLALLEDDATAAVGYLQRSSRTWAELQMPYEAAHSRRRLGDAHRTLGNEAAASMEITSATATLERLRGGSS